MIGSLAVDTSRTAADDLFDSGKEPSMQGQIRFRLEPRSSAILLSDGGSVRPAIVDLQWTRMTVAFAAGNTAICEAKFISC
jgi:hypothetical protein